MSKQVLPKGWTQERIRKVIAHYDSLTDEQWAAEDEAAFSDPRMTMMSVPSELVPAIARLIEDHEQKSAKRRARNRRGTNEPSKRARRRISATRSRG